MKRFQSYVNKIGFLLYKTYVKLTPTSSQFEASTLLGTLFLNQLIGNCKSYSFHRTACTRSTCV